MRALAVIAALVVTWGTEARAACASPLPFVLPWDGQTLPENGVLYLFVPTENEKAARTLLEELKVETEEGQPLRFTRERIHRSELQEVFTLRVSAKVGTSFFVRPLHQAPVTVVAKRPAPKTLALEKGIDRNFQWMCSFESSRALVPSLDAPAFRVKWNDKTVVLPGRSGAFARYTKELPPLELRLGHQNCHGEFVRWTQPTKFTITALLSDGREVTAAPLTLEPPPPYESLPTR